ncbi:MAG: hypothetical protein EXQ58_13860 [Acidobacteria bacterium]|nr:hypothetical protein [Acidobacteriota bacterium]
MNHLTLDPLTDPQLQISSNQNFVDVYRSPDGPVFDQGLAHWVGKCRQPMRSVTFTATAQQPAGPVELKRSIDLPAEAVEHPFIPRNWAKARVDFLLRKIETEGEDAASISEIIVLSKKYKFVTPYTSFLAPKEMADGMYHCRLILRDKGVRAYEEKKSFVIDSWAPTIQASVDRSTYQPGDTVQVRIRSDADTRRIRLRVANLEPVEARWDAEGKASIGRIVLPSEIATGQHALEIVAEDFAHNVFSRQLMIGVIGR